MHLKAIECCEVAPDELKAAFECCEVAPDELKVNSYYYTCCLMNSRLLSSDVKLRLMNSRLIYTTIHAA
jgi:hypothetical protein